MYTLFQTKKGGRSLYYRERLWKFLNVSNEMHDCASGNPQFCTNSREYEGRLNRNMQLCCQDFVPMASQPRSQGHLRDSKIEKFHWCTFQKRVAGSTLIPGSPSPLLLLSPPPPPPPPPPSLWLLDNRLFEPRCAIILEAAFEESSGSVTFNQLLKLHIEEMLNPTKSFVPYHMYHLQRKGGLARGPQPGLIKKTHTHTHTSRQWLQFAQQKNKGAATLYYRIDEEFPFHKMKRWMSRGADQNH